MEWQVYSSDKNILEEKRSFERESRHFLDVKREERKESGCKNEGTIAQGQYREHTCSNEGIEESGRG